MNSSALPASLPPPVSFEATPGRSLAPRHLARAALLAIGMLAATGCCGKSGKSNPGGTSTGTMPDREEPPPMSAMAMCQRLVTVGVAKNCRVGTAPPAGTNPPDASKLNDIVDFDGQLAGGKTAPGKVLAIASARARASMVVDLSTLKQTTWNPRGLSITIQSPRQDGEKNYEALMAKIKAASPQ